MRLLAVLFAVVLLTSGCLKVGPDFTPAEAPVAEKWLETGDKQISTESDLYEEWWTSFNDPVLNDLIQMASEQNLSLQVAGLRVLEARAELGFVTGQLYPQFSQARGDFTSTGVSKNEANTLGLEPSWKTAGIGFDTAWEMDFWGKFRRGVESADAQYLAAVASYDDIMVSLTAEVARSYITIRTLEDRIRIAKESAKIQKRSLEIAENRFDGGLVTELDVQQARSLLANTLAAIPRYRADYRRAQHALSVLLGKPPGDLTERLSASTAGIPKPPAEVAVGVPADLLRRRPDIRRAELQAAAQSALIGVSKADLLPHFSLVGSIGLRSSEGAPTRAGLHSGSSFSDLFDSDSFEYFVGPTFTWDLLNYGRIKNQVRIQDARFQQLQVSYQNTVINAAREVEDAMAGFVENQLQAGHLAVAVTASKRSVDISSLQYGEGLTDYQRVLDAQRGLRIDQDSLALVQGGVALQLVNMYRALGGGWQSRVDQPYVRTETQQEMAERTDWGDLLEEPKASTVEERDESGWRWPDW
jgi:NodT family efflux transporter outer membrane factor (OMF) lipoprotein